MRFLSSLWIQFSFCTVFAQLMSIQSQMFLYVFVCCKLWYGIVCRDLSQTGCTVILSNGYFEQTKLFAMHFQFYRWMDIILKQYINFFSISSVIQELAMKRLNFQFNVFWFLLIEEAWLGNAFSFVQFREIWKQYYTQSVQISARETMFPDSLSLKYKRKRQSHLFRNM
jgi:hypothetical protein